MADALNNPAFWSDAKEVMTDRDFWADAKVVDAPHNTVFHEDTGRVIALPQTLNAKESEFLIKRDADQVKNFFAMEDVGPAEALGKGVSNFFMSMPQIGGALAKEQGELSKIDRSKDRLAEFAGFGMSGKLMKIFQIQKDMFVRALGSDKVIEKSQALIDRNKAYVAKNGWERPEQGGLSGAMYDLGQGASSLITAIGMAALTRSPETAGIFFGAMQKSQIYEEARAAGKTPEEAANISTLAGMAEGGLEFVGVDVLLKTLKGNKAVSRFVKGFAIEVMQEGSQATAEEAITQLSGTRKKELAQTIEDILYQAALGGIIGGHASLVLGRNTEEKAKEAGLPPDVAKKLGDYVVDNVAGANENLEEFIDRELAPIAQDEQSAAQFIKLMQKFGNNEELVNPEQLKPSDRKVFDQYIEMFNTAKFDAKGVAAVEQVFHRQLKDAGVPDDVAVAAAKIMGARADAASRALGVTPEEWLTSKGVIVRTEKEKTELVRILEHLRGEKKIAAGAKRPKQPILSWMKRAGGVRSGSKFANELNFMGVNQKTNIGLFKNLDVMRSDQAKGDFDNISPETFEFETGIKPEIDDAGYVDRDWLLETIRSETFNAPEIDASDAYIEDVIRELDEREIDVNEHSVDEIVKMLSQPRDETPFYQADLLNTETDAFKKWFGDSKVVDENGDPLVVYHGTNTTFEEFSKSRLGGSTKSNSAFEGFFFVDNKEVAQGYGELANTQKVQELIEQSQAAERIGEFDLADQLMREAENLEQTMDIKEGVQVIPVYLSIQNPKIIDADGAGFMDLEESLTDTLKSAKKEGHDGVIIKNFRDNAGYGQDTLADHYVTFEQGQIKSVDNRGTFDPNDPRILFQEGVPTLEKIRAAWDEMGIDGIISEKSGVVTLNKIIIGKDKRNQGIGTKAMKMLTDYADKTGQTIVLSPAPDFGGSKIRLVKFYKNLDFVENKGRNKDFRYRETMLRRPQGGSNKLLQDNARGSITFTEEGAIIDLFKTANPSTLFHELGHLFLRDMRDVAKATKRPRARHDYKVIKDWLGAKGDRLTRAQEEKFARGFEQYLREGKAPKPALQEIFDRFKAWLENIYKSAQDLNVEISDEVREVFDRMLGGDFAEASTLAQERFERDRAKDYEIVANQPDEGTLARDTGDIFKDFGDVIGDAMTPISTRLGKINQELKHAVRKFIFNTQLHVREDQLAIKPFVAGVSKKFSEGDYRVLDLALKNRDTEKVDFLMEKYGLTEEYAKMRELLDGFYIQAQDAGMDLGYIDDYFPRSVRRGMVGEYLAAIRNQKIWSDIKIAMAKADPDSKFTPEEKAEFVNSYLRGYRQSVITMAASGHTKERSVIYVTPEMNKYYEDSMQTLINYVQGMRHGIEERKFFGKAADDAEDSIGAFVLDLVERGKIEPQEEAELRRLLKAVVEPSGPGKALGWARDAAYIYTMGSPISAITQIQDLAFSMYKNGYWRTAGSVTKFLTGRSILTKEDLGIERVLEEFSDKTRSSNAVRNIFRATGLTFMDNLGKQTFIDAAYSRVMKEARKGKPEFKEYMQQIFGDRADQVQKDLLAGEMTDEVKYILFSELSDFQPISIAEMPIGYAAGGNWRVLYMLKSYTVKMFDIYRREAYDHIGSGDPKRIVKGFTNLTSLAIALMLMGLPTDALKDFLLGRKTPIEDMVMNNILRLFGISKYQIYKGKQDGYARTAAMTLLPPFFSITDDLVLDAKKIATGKIKPEDAQALSHVPLVGKFYYWWWGGGEAKKSGSSTSRP